jgi:NTP pyrophosphatase (non-canonical NTP hydrolase)
MNFTFPETTFVEELTPLQQIRHIESELAEVIAETKRGVTRLDSVDLEVLDLLHSCETYLRIRKAIRGKEYIERLVEKVTAKNEKRGYYLTSKRIAAGC